MKKIQNRKLEFILSLIVEIIEFTIISSIGFYILQVSLIDILTILLTFFISRIILSKLGYKNGHFKIVTYFDMGWVRCFGWTSILLLTSFATTYISDIVGILFTIFTALMISNYSDIEELVMGKKRKESEIQQIYTWIRYNQSDPRVVNIENALKNDNMLYEIYQEMFIKGTGLGEMAEKLNFRYDTYVLPYVNRIIGKFDVIYEIKQIIVAHQYDYVMED